MSLPSGDPARAVIALLVLLAVVLLVYAVSALRRGAGISAALEPYTLTPSEPTPEVRHLALAETSLVGRAADLTTRLFRPSRLLPVIETSFEKADWPVRAAEALFFHVMAVAVLTLSGAILGGPGVAVLALLVSVLAPIFVVRLAITRRRQRFETHFPDALQMLASSLRSGRSLLQALEAMVDETSEPVAPELGRALGQARLGRPIEDALEEMARRLGSEDARFVATAVRMQRPIGGNLADLLTLVADTMVERARLRGDVRALTAEGRMSAFVLGILPIVLGVVVYAVDPAYMSVLFHDPLGRSMLAGAAVLAVAGFFWMKRTLEVDI